MIDLHSHLLPDIDDGPRTMAETLAMAEAAVADGTTVMACTPHVASNYPGTTGSRVREVVEATREALDRAGIPLRIVTGAEIALDRVEHLDDETLRDASLGGAGRWLLLEMPFRGWPVRLPDILTDLELRGFQVVLAHPERAESVQYQPSRMQDLVGRGALVQVTAASLTGENGRVVRQCVTTLLRNGLVHFIASDAHSATWRPPGLTDGLASAANVLRVEPDELRWMVEDGPRLVLEGAAVRPPRLGVESPAARSARIRELRALREVPRPGGARRARPPGRGSHTSR